MMNIVKSFFILFFVAAFVAQVQAQQVYEEVILSEEFYTQAEIDAFAEDLIPIGEALPVDAQGNTSCFDHYEFGSVQVKLNKNLAGTVPGVPMQFKGYVENNNAYPVVDGLVYVRIFKIDGNEKNVNGSEVVDQFVALRDVNIPANGMQNISVSWDVPVWVRSGDYQLATYFVSNAKYNLLGLTFTDDIVGNTVDFEITNGETSGVFFNKNTVTINDETYRFAAFPPRIEGDVPVTITAELVNTTDALVTVRTSYKTYYWDAMRAENKINDARDVIDIPANSSVPISYTVSNTDLPVYYSVLEATYKDTKTILNPRFVREEIGRARINFPSIKTYPLVAGQSAEVFACLHSTSDSVVADGRLELEVFDANNESIHFYTYEGAITPEMMGMIDSFVPEENHETFSVQARLYQNNVLLEEDIMTYNCIQLGGCATDSDDALSGTLSEWYYPFVGFLVVLVIGLLVTIIGVLLVKQFNK